LEQKSGKQNFKNLGTKVTKIWETKFKISRTKSYKNLGNKISKYPGTKVGAGLGAVGGEN
jgi:hypothetical protein